MPMGVDKEHAWPIYVNGKISEVFITTGTDDEMAKRQAEGKKKMISDLHTAGAVHLEGPFPTSRK